MPDRIVMKSTDPGVGDFEVYQPSAPQQPFPPVPVKTDVPLNTPPLTNKPATPEKVR